MPDTLGAQTLFAAATRQMQSGDYAQAEQSLRAALALDPDYAPAHGNLGYVLSRRGLAAEAEAAYRRCLQLRPDYVEIQLSHGAVLLRLKRLEEAEAACRRAVALKPESAAGWSNLGVVLAAQQREGEAEQCQRRAIALDAAYGAARFNLSYLLLRQGVYEEGFAMFEARDWYAGFAAPLRCPRWLGEPLAGKRLLIAYEPGHGDMIFFIRYAPELKKRGALTTLVCHPALAGLFSAAPGIDHIIPINTPFDAGAYDCWTPLASLPHYCATRIDTIPAALPYLRADPAQTADWAERLAQLPAGPRVGLVWRGNPNFENDADRSLPGVATLAPLLAIPGIRFISLQKGIGENEAEAGLLNVAAQLPDFAATASMVMNLDLVISVDTAVAHLAGALARDCWLLLPDYKTDWRWLKARADSPWYPGVMRLFRQARGGGWDAVIAEVAGALGQWRAARKQ